MSFVGDLFGGGAGEDAAKASIKGSEIAAESQREALNYLKEREAVPQAYREQAIQKLGAIYGLNGLNSLPAVSGTDSTGMAIATPEGYSSGGIAGTAGEAIRKALADSGFSEEQINATINNPYSDYNQQDFIGEIINTPLYQSIIGGRKSGEDAILRNAAATGGLRSGNADYALYDYNTQLQNQALLQSYNDQLMGLQGMAGLPSNANNIANLESNIGQTLGQGQIAAAQARLQGSSNSSNNAMGWANLGLQGYSSGLFSDIGGWIGGMFSDRRLKSNLKIVGSINGFNWYSFRWNSIAENLGLSGETFGIMADEVFDKNPKAVCLKDGFMFVDYERIGVL